MNLNKEQKAAAEMLADEIYNIHREAESASFMVDELFDQFFNEDFNGTQSKVEKMTLKFERAQAQFNILIDYVASLRNKLRELNKAAVN